MGALSPGYLSEDDASRAESWPARVEGIPSCSRGAGPQPITLRSAFHALQARFTGHERWSTPKAYGFHMSRVDKCILRDDGLLSWEGSRAQSLQMRVWRFEVTRTTSLARPPGRRM
jgi:hypothetical protein